MSGLANARILTKIISVIVLLGVVVAGGVWFAAGRMQQINDGYSHFLAKDVKALVATTRLNIVLNRAWQVSYRIIAENDPAVIRQDADGLG